MFLDLSMIYILSIFSLLNYLQRHNKFAMHWHIKNLEKTYVLDIHVNKKKDEF